MTTMMMDDDKLIVALVARLLHWQNRVTGIGVALPVEGRWRRAGDVVVSV
jgi:hypothetical protein